MAEKTDDDYNPVPPVRTYQASIIPVNAGPMPPMKHSGGDCPRIEGQSCDFCGEPAPAPCPLAEPLPFEGAPIGGVQGTCNPDDGVCEACQ